MTIFGGGDAQWQRGEGDVWGLMVEESSSLIPTSTRVLKKKEGEGLFHNFLQLQRQEFFKH